MIDLSGIETQILTGLAGLIGLGLLWLIQRAAGLIKQHLTAGQTAALDDAAGKALQFGITQAQGMIKAKGWDHVDVKDAVVATAAQYAASKFPDALKGAGIDTTSVASATASLDGILQRKFPEVAAQMAASPATPPAAA